MGSNTADIVNRNVPCFHGHVGTPSRNWRFDRRFEIAASIFPIFCIFPDSRSLSIFSNADLIFSDTWFISSFFSRTKRRLSELNGITNAAKGTKESATVAINAYGLLSMNSSSRVKGRLAYQSIRKSKPVRAATLGSS